MKKTYNTDALAHGNIELNNYRLPNGMGAGALRHQIADAVRDNWDNIIANGAIDPVRDAPLDFLGAAADPTAIMDANRDQALTFDTLEGLKLYAAHAQSLHNITIADVIEEIGRIMVDDIAGWVAQYIRDNILDQTGIDPDSWPENAALAEWEVK